MKQIIAGFTLSLISMIAIAQTNVFTIEVENQDDTVSPGGYLLLKIYGSVNSGSSNQYGYKFSLSEPSASGKSRSARWHGNDTHARYLKIKINDTLDFAIPKSVTVYMHKYFNKDDIIAQQVFYIKEGNHGHQSDAAYLSKYHKKIHIRKDYDNWNYYNIFCISSKTGRCKFDIKKVDVDKYHGQQPAVAVERCSDQGFPLQYISVRDSLVFNAVDLIVESTNEITIPDGHIELLGVYCRIISDSPFTIRRLNSGEIPFEPVQGD